MQVVPAEVIGLGALFLAGLAHYKLPPSKARPIIKAVLVAVVVVAGTVAILSPRNSPAPITQTATTHGNDSPVLQVAQADKVNLVNNNYGPPLRLLRHEAGNRLVAQFTKTKPVAVQILAAGQSTETMQLARQFEQIFRSAGYQDISLNGGWMSTPEPATMDVLVWSNAEPALKEALKQLFIETGQKVVLRESAMKDAILINIFPQ